MEDPLYGQVVFHRKEQRFAFSAFRDIASSRTRQALAARFYLALIDFMPTKLTGFSPVETNGRPTVSQGMHYVACAMPGPTGSPRVSAAAQPLLSVSGLVLQLQKVDRYTTRRARPIDTGHNFVQQACRT